MMIRDEVPLTGTSFPRTSGTSVVTLLVGECRQTVSQSSSTLLINNTQASCASSGPYRPRELIDCPTLPHSRRTCRTARSSTAAEFGSAKEVQKVTKSSDQAKRWLQPRPTSFEKDGRTDSLHASFFCMTSDWRKLSSREPAVPDTGF